MHPVHERLTAFQTTGTTEADAAVLKSGVIQEPHGACSAKRRAVDEGDRYILGMYTTLSLHGDTAHFDAKEVMMPLR
jgi:hypothetical protein